MISHQYRCIFIHQRKTAGCSIITSFGLTDAQPEWRLFNDGTLSDEWRRRDEIAPGYRVFTVIRNPWDRFVSGWKYLSATRKKSLKKVLKNLPPPETGHDYKHLTRPQLHILMDEQGKFVPDCVLRFEHLAEDYAKFCDLIGKPDKTLPKLNSTEHDPYQSCFDAKSMERFAHHFKKDIEFLGYHFSGPANHTKLRGKILV